MKFRHSALVASIAVSALTLAGCSSSAADDEASDSGPFRVLVTGAISGQGSLAANAQTSILAAKAGVEQVNKDGGIGGRQVELTVTDDGGDATKAVSNLRDAINSGKRPDLYLNSGPSTVSAATLPILKQNKILSFNVGPTNDSSDPAQFPLNFDLSPSPTEYAVSIARYAKSKNYQQVGVIHGSSAYGEAFGQAMDDALSAEGVSASGAEEYDVAALDMTAQLQALENKGTQALVIDAYGAPLGYLLSSLERLDWNIPLIGNTSVSGTALIAKPAPEGALGTRAASNLVMQVFPSTVYDASDTAVNTMVDAMASMGSIPSTLILADNYDPFGLVAAAAKKVGSTADATELAKALEDQDVLDDAKTAFLPRYHYSAQSHAPNLADDGYRFVPPSKVVNGQYGNPAAA
ncbi:ABC transporter substrate-binding protein [Rhodococcus hoagii]|nr:ABC transporter substrate-binding protein [Prescottella equi]NKR88148.1 ABC transporter substrate-binding protein [Prescottella equi]NKS07974.1 ABC transporter substrate-binding protein [Prescottella equi]NKS77818.1 ABC transporter substrate-binding protein [Prescottella equi]NKS93039.1 ABC transporter substrate-binding protein [Prescottella equi]NKT10390.1 ABC transporter substrate-binding protein [Prescottella equi]